MIFNNTTANKTAELLLQINAIKLNSENPFTWASGWKSPIYCDNRIILSYPEVRGYIKNAFAEEIKAKFGTPDVIAGVATGAIGIGMLVAEVMDLPFVYVRPEAKKHGRQNQVEGHFEKGQKVIVVEDLISTGGSSLMAVEALRNEGADVIGMAAIFTYGFPVSVEKITEAKLDVFTLSNYEFLIEQAIKLNYIPANALEDLKEWRTNPAQWRK
jgi:orotate phosphoribosyltransferase